MIEIKKPMSTCVECGAGCAPSCAENSCADITPTPSKPDTPPITAIKPTGKTSGGAGMGGVRGAIARLRKVRHIEIYAAVAVIAVMVLIFFSSIGSGLANKTAGATTTTGGITTQTHTDDERRLLGLLQKIDGIGSVDLLINDNGIVIVATGAKNLRVRNDILKTVFTLYKNTTGIEILF